MNVGSTFSLYGALTAAGVAAYSLYAVVSGFRRARRENEERREALRRDIQRETRELLQLQNDKIDTLQRELAETRRELVLAKRQLAEARYTESALRNRIRELEAQMQGLTNRMNGGESQPRVQT